jgi:hypothetical protein
VATYAGVTQWLEFLPSKQGVAGSNPVSRSISFEIAESVVEIIAVINAVTRLFFEVIDRVFGSLSLNHFPLVTATGMSMTERVRST